MKRSSWASALALGTLLLSAAATPSYAALIDFEDLNDSDTVTTQYAGVTFSNAVALSAGISLNDFDFPPRSGSNVIVDAGGPMSLTFAGAVSAFSGYFTYAAPLTVTAYALDGTALGSTASAFAANAASFGAPGSSPNELLSLSGLGDIYSVLIAGDPAGFSFVIDDVSFIAAAPTSVPEPAMLSLLMAGLAVVFGMRRRVRGAP